MFRSDRFPAYEGEEQQINPGIWGKRLAEFLREHLCHAGFETDEPQPEDWGWILPIANDDFPLWIGCARHEEYFDSFLCFIEPHQPVVRRLLTNIDTHERVDSLRRALDEILNDAAGIREKRWWTYEEFANPASERAGIGT